MIGWNSLEPEEAPMLALARALALALAAALLPASGPAQALSSYKSGGIVYLAGYSGKYVGYVDPDTGERVGLVSYAELGIDDPYGVSVGPDGAIYMVDQSTGPAVLYRLDPITNDLTVVSDPSSSGPAIHTSRDIDVTASGEVFATGMNGADHVVYEVDPVTGGRTILSGAATGAGTELTIIRHLDVAPDGRIYVTARIPNGDEVLFEIDPLTGDRTILFDEYDVGEWPRDVVVSVLGDVYVAALKPGSVWRWDPDSGLPVLVNDGPDKNRGIEVAPDGTIYTLDSDGDGTYIDAIDPDTGVRTRLMDTSVDPGPGIYTLRDFAVVPAGVDLVPAPEPSVTILFLATASWWLGGRRRRRA
jgi:hypothetical protein